MIDGLNRWLGAFLARRAMRKLGFGRRISWFVVPHPGPLAKRLGESLTVYYCIDDYASYPGMDPVAIQKLDDDLTRKADVVFVAPRALLEAKRTLNRNIHFSPHGVDFEMFSQASDPATPLAEEVRGLKHPVIGYFGTVGEFMDFDLLGYLIEARPSWTFLFVGLIAADVSRLRRYPNVIFAGPQPYENLPGWAAAFDVAIYAHQVNRQTRNSNPLKLREYLATGKPVVSVVTPETATFAEVVYLAENPAAYLAAIERALREETPELRRKRMDAVTGVSWDARFAETIAVVDGILASR
jgi:glycosyltransferase involved in cell wall biosynthesis